MSIVVKVLKQCDEEKWDDYARRSHSNIYMNTKWRHLVKEIFGHDSYYLFAENEQEEFVGILPLIQLKSLLFGNFLVSMPYFNYGGVIGETSAIEQKLIEEADRLKTSLGCSHVELREIKKRESNTPVKVHKVTMLLQLPDDPEVLWKSIGAKRRAQVKRPLREGVEFLYGGKELIDEFYGVFSVNMRDLGTPVYSKEFFRAIFEYFPENASIGIVQLHGKAVGCGFLIGYEDRLEIPWASTMRKYNRLGINMYMYWNILKTAIEKKYKIFDFGRSSKDAGTLKFKKQWGGEESQLYWYYLLSESDSLPEINPNNPKYLLAINIWQKLPLFLTKMIGPSIVKNLP